MSTEFVRKMLRVRPLRELLGRVHKTVKDPVVVDLGCGDGNSIPYLRQTWPTGRLVCVDGEKEVLREAMGNCIDSNVSFVHSSIQDWVASGDKEKPNVIVANSVLHLVAQHEKLLPELVGMLPAGGVFALQIPCMADTTFVRILDEAAKEVGCTHTPTQPDIISPSRCYELLSSAASTYETWRADHHHYIAPEDIVSLYNGVGVNSTLWSSYTSAVGSSKAPDFTALVSKKAAAAFPLIPNTNHCLFTVSRFYLVLTKEGHGPIMGLRGV